MNTERTQAYGRIVRTLEEIGAVKLLGAEQERIRAAADALIFASEGEPAIDTALQDIQSLVGHLVESGRWTDERAATLIADVVDCGPPPSLVA